MRTRIPAFFILSLFFISVNSVSLASSSDIGLSITSALESRTEFFTSASIPFSLLSADTLSRIQLDILKSSLANAPTMPASIWASFYRALTASAPPGNLDNADFYTTLDSINSDPGLAWAVAQECRRFGYYALMDSALFRLHRQALSMGATVVPVVSQQLMHFALQSEKRGSDSMALHLFRMAALFDPLSPWPLLHIARINLPSHFAELATIFPPLWRQITNSWETQISGTYFLSRWLSFAIILLTLSIIATMIIKESAQTLHRLIEAYPQGLPKIARSILGYLLLFSPLFLGALTFIWITLLVFWNNLGARFKKPVAFVAMALFLLPALSIIEDTCLSILGPRKGVVLYNRSAHESPDPGIVHAIESRQRIAPNDYLGNLASGIIALKNNDLLSAAPPLETALRLSPEDPVALSVVGILRAAEGENASAEACFTKASRLAPANAPIIYNRGQHQIEINQSLEGMDLVAQSTRIDPELINDFVGKNDRYFPFEKPLLRRYLLADYQPSMFWRTFFPATLIKTLTEPSTWGRRFFGLNPVWSFCTFIVLGITLLVLRGRAKSSLHQVKHTGACSICGDTTCRRCGRGSYCGTCARKLKGVSGDRERGTISEKIIIHRQFRTIATARILDLIFPGTGLLYDEKFPTAGAIFIICVTSLVWSLIATFSATTFWYPAEVTRPFFYLTILAAVAYSAFFVVCGIVGLARAAGLQGGQHGS